jgi:hypothetical protein
MGLALWPRTRVAASLATHLAETGEITRRSLKTALAALSRRMPLLAGANQVAQLPKEEPQLPSLDLNLLRADKRSPGFLPHCRL